MSWGAAVLMLATGILLPTSDVYSDLFFLGWLFHGNYYADTTETRDDPTRPSCTPHTVVLRKTQKMHIKNNKHSAAAFYIVIHKQKEFKWYLSI